MIKIALKTPKKPPNNLFKIPKLAKLAITVNVLAKADTVTTTKIKVMAKAVT